MPARIGPKNLLHTRVFLREWREWRDLSQEQLGGRIEPPVDKGTVSRWENAKPGKISLGVIAAFAEAVDRSTRDMYELPPPKGKPIRPSLDALAGHLDDEDKDVIVNFIHALNRSRR